MLALILRDMCPTFLSVMQSWEIAIDLNLRSPYNRWVEKMKVGLFTIAYDRLSSISLFVCGCGRIRKFRNILTSRIDQTLWIWMNIDGENSSRLLPWSQERQERNDCFWRCIRVQNRDNLVDDEPARTAIPISVFVSIVNDFCAQQSESLSNHSLASGSTRSLQKHTMSKLMTSVYHARPT